MTARERWSAEYRKQRLISGAVSEMPLAFRNALYDESHRAGRLANKAWASTGCRFDPLGWRSFVGGAAKLYHARESVRLPS